MRKGGTRERGRDEREREREGSLRGQFARAVCEGSGSAEHIVLVGDCQRICEWLGAYMPVCARESACFVYVCGILYCLFIYL